MIMSQLSVAFSLLCLMGTFPGSRAEAQLFVAPKQEVQQEIAQATAITWTPFTSEKARVSANFPGTPTVTESKMNGQYPLWTVQAKTPELLCQTVSVIYPTPLSRAQAEVAVDSAIFTLGGPYKARLKSSVELNRGTYGKVAIYQSKDQIIKAHVFVVGDVMYQLILGGSPQTIEALDEKEFFGSFKGL